MQSQILNNSSMQLYNELLKKRHTRFVFGSRDTPLDPLNLLLTEKKSPQSLNQGNLRLDLQVPIK